VMIGMDPELFKLILLIVGGLILLILVILLIRWFWKSRSRAEKNKLIPASPYVLALQQLDLLCQKPVLDTKGFYFDLGGLIKRYIGSSYGMNAVEMTTQELSKHIRVTRMDPGLVQSVSKFLIVSDPFRYGPMVPDASRVKEDLASVRQLITAMEADLESKRTSATPSEEERD